MKKSKLFLISAGVLALLIAAAIVFVLTNINTIVKAAIEKHGSQATKTTVRVSAVRIKLSSGEGSISALTVANPRGFSKRDLFSLGKISVGIDVRSITKSPIVIPDIRISGPEILYEMNSSGASNLDALLKNLQGPEAAPKKEPGGKKKGKEIRLFIRKLVFENGRVEARIAALGDRLILLDLPRLELTNIGGNRGATPSEVATTVATALARETAKVVTRSQGEKYLKKGAGDLLNRYLRK